MRRVCIVCEGQTEVEFVKTCLTPHLQNHQVLAYPSLLQSPSGNHRGGRVTIERLVKFIAHQYREADRITTLVDFYGFKDRDGLSRQQVETAIMDGVKKCTSNFDPRFVLPYVQMHEFEGLLFSDVQQFAWVADGWSSDVGKQLNAVRKVFATPEDINDSPQTAPSKRILAIFPEGSYSKVEHGPLIAEAIGLDVIRKQCPAFHAWLCTLEAWGK